MKQITIRLTDHDADFLFLCAGIRYCIQRRSYANSLGLRFLDKHWRKFSKAQKQRLLAFIGEELKYIEKWGGWMKLHDAWMTFYTVNNTLNIKGRK